MATRSTIKSKSKGKAKLGALAAGAVAGVALTSQAAEASTLESHSSLLDAAFKLLEAGQQEALNQSSAEADQFVADMQSAEQQLADGELADQMPQAQAPVVLAMAGGGAVESDGASMMLAQAETASTSAAAAAGAAEVAVEVAASGAGAAVAFVPLAPLVGIGAGAVAAAAITSNNNDGTTTGSDLGDSKAAAGLMALDSNEVVNIVGNSTAYHSDAPADSASTKVSPLGSSSVLDSLGHDFF